MGVCFGELGIGKSVLGSKVAGAVSFWAVW